MTMTSLGVGQSLCVDGFPISARVISHYKYSFLTYSLITRYIFNRLSSSYHHGQLKKADDPRVVRFVGRGDSP